MKLTNEDVREILQLLDATKFGELHVETERFKLTLRRRAEAGAWAQEFQVLSRPNVVRNAGTRDEHLASPAATKPADSTAAGQIEVRAHLPGTFYRAPQPGAPPFVELGSRVVNDTVVAIIETMKLMNAVPAGADGEITDICCENAQPVERGAVLMRIKQRPE